MTDRLRWPDHPVIYEIYPRSFADTHGHGGGDLRGITERLDHVAALGVDAIWLSPFFVSPFVDGGYDIVDHCAVDPRFGTLADFDALVARAHDLGLLVMIDQVFNHTSSDHEWFQRSLRREDGYEDLYVWADARDDGSPPTNWIAFFGTPAWRWYPQRSQYCLHKFLQCQPCLDHRHPSVHERLRAINRFWLDRGVDGFRYDAVTSFFHHRDLADNPPAPPEHRKRIPGPPNNPYTFQDHVHDVLPDECAGFTETLRDWVGPDTYMLAEINKGPNSVEVTHDFTKPGRFDAGYTFDLAERGLESGVLREILERMADRDGFAWWLSSHDQPRHVSKLGDGSARDARLFAAFLTAMPGPLILFQGEELGQPQATLPLEMLHDPYDVMYWPEPLGRDGARTPMAWDSGKPRCGFSGAKPWLPVQHPEDGGVAQQTANPASVLNFYRKALRLRRELGLGRGVAEILDSPPGTILARMKGGGRDLTLTVNLGHSPWDIPAAAAGLEWVLSSSECPEGGTIPPRCAAWWR
ncbi:alpha-amylase family glycosyl hydrolase [Roseibacterium sp. SDUM158017]|uniref:alpha-amylase family glycosyl hydrolase n=1 Tax=Roseicyclus salinarum TaxID=3036773 RepID=UPI0024154A78|nr:alpha-amylase family glycosyl hydrolase [Roseibacterium sp. SDUM158017]MDG4650505.1 alpha-amylase family glycosyl hydrolase [Roseibacterium sp. SDUM158017]